MGTCEASCTKIPLRYPKRLMRVCAAMDTHVLSTHVCSRRRAFAGPWGARSERERDRESATERKRDDQESYPIMYSFYLFTSYACQWLLRWPCAELRAKDMPPRSVEGHAHAKWRARLERSGWRSGERWEVGQASSRR